MQQCFNATNNIFEILNREPAIKDEPGAIEISGSEGDIRIENVTFRYRPGLPPAVRDLSLHIEPGKYYALVGSSGAGKSTILSLLLRFYEPEAGVIRLDGRDINTIKQISLREQIGMVSQETFLFHDSILNNIRYGRLNASKEEVIDAAKRAYAHEFIMHQPNGLRDGYWRQGMPFVRWPATTCLDRAGAPQERAGFAFGRGDVSAGFRGRT